MVIVDTDVLIAAFRNNEMAKTALRRHSSRIALSAVTVMELYVGAKTPQQKQAVSDIISDHQVIPIDRSITEVTIRLLRDHNTGTSRSTCPMPS